MLKAGINFQKQNDASIKSGNNPCSFEEYLVNLVSSISASLQAHSAFVGEGEFHYIVFQKLLSLKITSKNSFHVAKKKREKEEGKLFDGLFCCSAERWGKS